VILMVLSRQDATVSQILEMNRARIHSIMPFIAFLAAVYAAHLIHSVRQGAFRAQRFGQYHLKQLLGTGAMGEVYEAEHLLLKRPCAIKLIRPENVGSPAVLERFANEVKATAGLSHWNTVQVYDYGQTADGIFYYVMELLPGLSLAELVQHYGPLPATRVVHLLRQVCHALQEAHDAGLIHRDVKPANIFVSRRGGVDDVIKLLDFGLVQTEEDGVGSAKPMIAGTPHFMSPEQAMGKILTQGSDLYSLGATAYYLLTGKPLFPGRQLSKVIAAQISELVTPPSSLVDGIPPDVEQVVMKCLQKNPADRFASARELEHDLSKCTCAGLWAEDDARHWWRDVAKNNLHAPNRR